MSRTTQDMREAWPNICSEVPLARHVLAPGVYVQVHRDTREAVGALACVLQSHGYHVRPGDTGAYNCRPITGNKSRTSLHAHGIALDVNWNTNPYRSDGVLVTDMPSRMIGDTDRVRTKSGAQVWRWGGHYQGAKDAMHFEIVATPAELKSGIDWATVAMPSMTPGRADTWPLLQEGDRGPTVGILQAMVGVPNDGAFGAKTKAAVESYQRSRGLKVDGEVGLGTWTALLHQQPALAPGEPSPVKLATR